MGIKIHLQVIVTEYYNIHVINFTYWAAFDISNLLFTFLGNWD